MTNIENLPFYKALIDADAMQVDFPGGTARFIPEVKIDREDDPFLELEYATIDRDIHGFYFSPEQMENARNVDIGTWLITGTTEPDFIGEEDSTENFVVKTMAMKLSNDRQGSRPKDWDPNWRQSN